MVIADCRRRYVATMSAFAIMALLGLAVLAVSGMARRYISLASEFWAFVLVALGVGAAWLINLNLFSVWGIATRSSAIGVTLTGLIIAGSAYFWHEILAFFGGLSRKFTDEAVTLEKSEHLRRVACDSTRYGPAGPAAWLAR